MRVIQRGDMGECESLSESWTTFSSSMYAEAAMRAGAMRTKMEWMMKGGRLQQPGSSVAEMHRMM